MCIVLESANSSEHFLNKKIIFEYYFFSIFLIRSFFSLQTAILRQVRCMDKIHRALNKKKETAKNISMILMLLCVEKSAGYTVRLADSGLNSHNKRIPIDNCWLLLTGRRVSIKLVIIAANRQ